MAALGYDAQTDFLEGGEVFVPGGTDGLEEVVGEFLVVFHAHLGEEAEAGELLVVAFDMFEEFGVADEDDGAFGGVMEIEEVLAAGAGEFVGVIDEDGAAAAFEFVDDEFGLGLALAIPAAGIDGVPELAMGIEAIAAPAEDGEEDGGGVGDVVQPDAAGLAHAGGAGDAAHVVGLADGLNDGGNAARGFGGDELLAGAVAAGAVLADVDEEGLEGGDVAIGFLGEVLGDGGGGDAEFAGEAGLGEAELGHVLFGAEADGFVESFRFT